MIVFRAPVQENWRVRFNTLEVNYGTFGFIRFRQRRFIKEQWTNWKKFLLKVWTALERSHAWFWGMWNVQLVDWIRRITVLVDCWGGLPWRGRKRDLGVNRSVVDIRLLKPKSEWPQTQVKSSIVILPAPRVDTNENRLVSSVLVFRKDVMRQSVLIHLCTLTSCKI